MSSAANTITTAGRRPGGRQLSRSWRLWLLIAAATLAAATAAAFLVHRAVGSTVVVAPPQVTTTTGAERTFDPGRRLVQVNEPGAEAPVAPPVTSRGSEFN